MAQRLTDLVQGEIGIALGGGAARGLAHIGVLRALDEAGIRPAFVSGTSMGAIIGALFASGKAPGELLEIARKASWTKIIDISLRGGLVKGVRLGRFLEEHLPATFEELPVPLAVTATAIEDGDERVFRSGPLIPAIRASAAFPGVFEPVEVEGTYYLDGGIVDSVPVEAIRNLGARAIVAVDVGPPADRSVDIDDPDPWWKRFTKAVTLQRRNLGVDLLLKSVDIMQARITSVRLSLSAPDVLIRVQMPDIKLEDFHRLEDAVKAGYRAARSALAPSGPI